MHAKYRLKLEKLQQMPFQVLDSNVYSQKEYQWLDFEEGFKKKKGIESKIHRVNVENLQGADLLISKDTDLSGEKDPRSNLWTS